MKSIFSLIKKKPIFFFIFLLILLIILILILILIIKTIKKSNKETFTTSPNTTKKLDPNTTTNNLTYLATTWKPETVYNYLLTQKTNNENIIYDPIILQQNATQEEADFFLTNGYWPWSQETKDEYIKILDKNTIVRNFAPKSVDTDQKIYPEKTIQEILAFNTPEGKFVLQDAISNEKENQERASKRGMGIFGFTSGLLNPSSNKIVGCRKLPTDKTDEPYLISPGKGTYSQVLPKARKLDYAEIPELINGFEFTNGPCNPCTILNLPPDYSCKFKVNKELGYKPEVFEEE
jgi:hypothetical protein